MLGAETCQPPPAYHGTGDTATLAQVDRQHLGPRSSERGGGDKQGALPNLL